VSNQPWYNSDDPGRHAWGWGRISIVILAVILVIGGIFYVARVATSDPRGAADAYALQNDAQNRMQSAAEFDELFNDIIADDEQLNIAQAELVDAQGREEQDLDFYRENVAGAKRSCLSAVSAYNTLAGNPQKNRWRPAGRPENIDVNSGNEKMDCKVNAGTPTLAPSAPAGKEETGAGVPSPAPGVS